MTTKPKPAFIGEPVAYLIALLGVGLFLLMLLFVIGLVVLPIAAVVIVAVLIFRYYQLQKLRVKVTVPVSKASSPALPDQQSPPSTEHDVEEFEKSIDTVVLRYLEKPSGRFSCEALSDAFTVVATQLYIDEALHSPPNTPTSTDLITLARHQDQLERWQRKTTDDATFRMFLDTVGYAYMTLRDHFPPYAFQQEPQPTTSPFTVPLYIAIEGDQLEELAAQFFLPELTEKHLFDRLREQIVANHDEIESSRTEATFDGLFADTPLGTFSGTNIPLSLPDETRFAGHWIIAPPGRGKTTLLHAMVVEDLSKEASVILIDSKGDLLEPIKRLKSIADRLVLIEPDPDHPLALNPLDIPKTNVNSVVSLLEYVFSSLLDAKMTPLQMTLFRSVLPALVSVVPDPTLETFRDVITNGVAPYRSYIDRLPPSERAFFYDKQNGFDSKTYQETRNQLIWRLQFLMSNQVVRSMFSASKTKLDIAKEMDAGKVILVDNSKAMLGEEGAEFFGRFFIALILAAAERRSGRSAKDKLPCYVYIDECQTVIKRDPKIATILDECRAQKIALILAHQRTDQIKDSDVLSALANCAVRFANSDDEAKYLADKLRTKAEFLRGLGRGRFGAFIRDLTPEAIALDVVPVDFVKYERLSDGEYEAIRKAMRTQYGTSDVSPGPSAPPPPPPSSTAPPAVVPGDESGPTPSDAPASW